MTTMSLRLTAGARDCSTYARNVFPLIEPSITHGAVIPFRRRPATKVRVFQCPCGTQPTSRSPRGHRPLSRTIFVLAAVSSMNTSRVELRMACRRFQHRRARATSGRSCSAARRLFFEADVVALEEAPHGSATACDPVLVHRRDHLIQRQIRLLLNQREQPRRMYLQWRRAPAARLGCATPSLVKVFHPFDCRTWADVELLGCLTSRRPRLQRVRSPACECPQNMPSAWLGPQTNQCRQTRPFTGPWESCDSIRQEHALGAASAQDIAPIYRPRPRDRISCHDLHCFARLLALSVDEERG